MRVIEKVCPNGRVALDHGSLVGTWHNSDRSAGGVRRLDLSVVDGQPRLRVFGTGRPQPYDWGEVEARCFATAPTSWAAWAFTAVYDVGFRTMRIAAYSRGGLLVVTTYNAFTGAGWPQPYWTREFLYRAQASAAVTGPPPERGGAEPERVVAVPERVEPGGAEQSLADRATAPLLPWELDPAPLVAVWRNVDPAATRLSHVRISERDGYLLVRPHGVWSPRRHDWHATVGSAFAADVRDSVAVAFTTFFELAVGQVEMVGYLDRRLLTVETASTYRDGSGRAPHYVREHFYPTEGGHHD